MRQVHEDDTAGVTLRDVRDGNDVLEIRTAPDLASIARCIGEFARQKRIHPAEVEYAIRWPRKQAPKLPIADRLPIQATESQDLRAVTAVRLDTGLQAVVEVRWYTPDCTFAPWGEEETVAIATLARHILDGGTAIVVFRDPDGTPIAGPVLKASQSAGQVEVEIGDGENHDGMSLFDLPRF